MSRRSLWCLLPMWLLVASFSFAAEEKPRVDCHGDPLPAHALARLGTARFVHGSKINCLAYSPDGKFLASGGYDKTIILWDAKSGRKLRILEGHRWEVLSLAFSPDSKQIASCCCGTTGGDLRLWNLATGKSWIHQEEKEMFTEALAFSLDGKTIATGHHANHIRLWEAETGKISGILQCASGNGRVSCLAFAPDGKLLAAAGAAGKIQFWHWKTEKEVQPKGKFPESVDTLAFSPDGSILATAGGGEVHLFRASTLAEMPKLEDTDGFGSPISFSPDGATLVCRHSDPIIAFWDIQSGKKLRQVSEENGRTNFAENARHFACSPDGRSVASAGKLDSGVIHVWNAHTGRVLHPQEGPLHVVRQVSFLRDGKTVILQSNFQDITVWPNDTEKGPRPFELSKESNCYPFLCPDRATLAYSQRERQVLTLLDIPSGKESGRCALGKHGLVTAMSADNKRAVFWMLNNATLERHAELWDLTTNKILHRFGPRSWGLVFSLDRRYLVVNDGDDHIVVWNLETMQELSRWNAPSHTVKAFSPDGRMLAVRGPENTLQLLETVTGKKRLLLTGHSNGVLCSAFSPDGKTVASGSADRTLRLWDVCSGKELQCFGGHLGHIEAVDFSPDGQRLVSGSEDMTALIWQIPAAFREHKLAAERPDLQEQGKLWEKLGDGDAASAYSAMQRLAAVPNKAVVLCRARLFPPPVASPGEIQGWIRQLDDEEFSIREKASENLERVEGEAEKALEKALKGDCSPEVRRRINALLETLKGKQLSIRVLRAVELLEQIGTPEAVDVLRQLEKKTGDVAVREEVRRSLGRLAAKQKAP